MTFLVGSTALAQKYVGANKAARYVGTSAEWAGTMPDRMTAWDPNRTADWALTLSDNGTTATVDRAEYGGAFGTIADTGHSSGEHAFTLALTRSDEFRLGLCGSATPPGDDFNTDGTIVLVNYGPVFQGAYNEVANLGYSADPSSTFVVKVNATKVWFRRDGGFWNGMAQADPDTGAGGIEIGFATPYYPCVQLYSPNDVCTADFTAWNT